MASSGAPGTVTLVGTRHSVAGAVGTDVAVEVANRKQSVVVDACKDCSIRVTNRCNSVALDKCSKCQLLLDDAPLLQITNCERLEVQALGSLGRAEIDRVSDVTIHVSPECIAQGFSLRSSRSTEVKVVVVEQEGRSRLVMVPSTIETSFDQEGTPIHKPVA